MQRAPVLFAALMLACSKTTDKPSNVVEDDPACAIGNDSRDVVLGVERHIVGQEITPEGDIQVEVGELTEAGRCTPKTECAVVTGESMQRLVALVRELGSVRHKKARVSPHYGFRSISARWAGGECSFSDGTTTPVDERDEKKFYRVYDAIRDAIVEARGAAEKRGPD